MRIRVCLEQAVHPRNRRVVDVFIRRIKPIGVVPMTGDQRDLKEQKAGWGK